MLLLFYYHSRRRSILDKSAAIRISSPIAIVEVRNGGVYEVAGYSFPVGRSSDRAVSACTKVNVDVSRHVHSIGFFCLVAVRDIIGSVV